ncbi:MAG: B-4DMT family transporter [Sciscionella sp.]
MRAWLIRGLVLAVLHAAADIMIGLIIVYHQSSVSLIRPLVIALLIGVAVAWGAADSYRQVADRGLLWLKASLLAGLAGGILDVIGRAIFVDNTGVWAIMPAITGGAAFTALLVLVPAGIGIGLGSMVEHAPGSAAASASHPPAEPAEGKDVFGEAASVAAPEGVSGRHSQVPSRVLGAPRGARTQRRRTDRS